MCVLVCLSVEFAAKVGRLLVRVKEKRTLTVTVGNKTITLLMILILNFLQLLATSLGGTKRYPVTTIN